MEIGKQVGEYIIEAEIGGGGMAKVYRARHVVLESLHALKVLDDKYRANPEARRRFLDEAKIQAKHIQHPGIVKVTNIVSTSDAAALVMDLVDGGSLEGYIAKKGKPFTAPEVLAFAVPILDAMQHAHDAGIIHRDLKPANVLLKKQGDRLIPMITDFGIAKVMQDAPGQTENKKKSTHADARMGTLGYMAPEQIRKAKDVTNRSDIFALGAMFYEMVTGSCPFEGESDFDVMEAIVHARFEPPEKKADPSITPNIINSIKRAMDSDPARRFADCREFSGALTGGQPVGYIPNKTTKTSGFKYEKSSSSGGKGKLIAGIAVAALGAGGAAVYMVTKGNTSNTASTTNSGSGSGSGSSGATGEGPGSAPAADVEIAKTGPELVSRMTWFKERMCSCGDAECTSRVLGELDTWQSKQPKVDLSMGEDKRFKALENETDACKNEIASRPPPIDAAIDAYEPHPPPPDVAEAPSDALTAGKVAYKVLEPGAAGATPDDWDKVILTYKTWSSVTHKFIDESINSEHQVNHLPPGLESLIKAIQVGNKVRAWVPAGIAGPLGARAKKGLVVFDLELVSHTDGQPPTCVGKWSGRGAPGQLTLNITQGSGNCGSFVLVGNCTGSLTGCRDGATFSSRFSCGGDYSGTLTMSCIGNSQSVSVNISGGRSVPFSVSR